MTINNKHKMDCMRIAGIGKAKVPSAVQKDNDESIVFFRELYKREKNTDVNLLEPMYSVEFDTIQGGHMSKPPLMKRDFLIPLDEKHDYDWLSTPPAAPLFPSLELEASSPEMVFPKELPVPGSVKPSSSRFSGKPEATKISRSALPPLDSSSKKNFLKGAPSISKEKNQPFATDKRSTYTVLTDRQQKAAAATATTGSDTTKRHSDRCHASQGSSASAVKKVSSPLEVPYKAPKNLLTTGSIFARRAPSTKMTKVQSRDPALGVNGKVEGGRARRQSCPAAGMGGIREQQADGKQSVLPAKGKAVTGSGPPCKNGEATLMKGMRRADGKKVRIPRFGGQEIK